MVKKIFTASEQVLDFLEFLNGLRRKGQIYKGDTFFPPSFLCFERMFTYRIYRDYELNKPVDRRNIVFINQVSPAFVVKILVQRSEEISEWEVKEITVGKLRYLSRFPCWVVTEQCLINPQLPSHTAPDIPHIIETTEPPIPLKKFLSKIR